MKKIFLGLALLCSMSSFAFNKLDGQTLKIYDTSTPNDSCSGYLVQISSESGGVKIPGLSVIIRHKEGNSPVMISDSSGEVCFYSELKSIHYIEVHWGSPFDNDGKYSEENIKWRKAYDLNISRGIIDINL